MNQIEVKTVSFMGDELMAAKDGETGKIHVGVSYVCKGIGLSEGQTKNEKKRVQEDVVLKQGGRNFILPTAGGNQDTLCIELEFLPLWLAKITITPNMQTEQPEVADKLIQYQLKAKDVLAAAFLPAVRHMTQAEILAGQAQLLVDIEHRQAEQADKLEVTNKRLDNIGDLVALNPNDWRRDSKEIIVKIAQKLGGNAYISDVHSEIYKLVDQRGAASLKRRLENMKMRMLSNGICRSKVDSLNKLDAIGEDKRLIEIYIAIVKEMAIKYGVGGRE